MLIIAERINSSRKYIAQAIGSGDAAFIQNEAKAQAEAGADYINVNAGTFVGEEEKYLTWLIHAVQQVTDLPLSIDSPDPRVIRAVLPLVKKPPMINSITLEPARSGQVLPLVREYGAKVIGLCQSEDAMAESLEEKVEMAGRLAESAVSAGIRLNDLYIDPLVYPLSVNHQSARIALDAFREIMARYPGVHTTCGLTNVSHGLPGRSLINRTFLAGAILHGMDSAIADPTDKNLYAAIKAAALTNGNDEYCMDYVKTLREGRFE